MLGQLSIRFIVSPPGPDTNGNGFAPPLHPPAHCECPPELRSAQPQVVTEQPLLPAKLCRGGLLVAPPRVLAGAGVQEHPVLRLGDAAAAPTGRAATSGEAGAQTPAWLELEMRSAASLSLLFLDRSHVAQSDGQTRQTPADALENAPPQKPSLHEHFGGAAKQPRPPTTATTTRLSARRPQPSAGPPRSLRP